MLAGRSVSEVERLEMAETWFDYLGETIPATQLDAVFRRAVLDHTTPYAINAFEMQMAYRAIQDEQATAAYEAAMERRRRDARHYECGRCGGMRWVFEDGLKRPCEGE